jgi:hypothetical protein
MTLLEGQWQALLKAIINFLVEGLGLLQYATNIIKDGESKLLRNISNFPIIDSVVYHAT